LAAIGVAGFAAALDLRQTPRYAPETPVSQPSAAGDLSSTHEQGTASALPEPRSATVAESVPEREQPAPRKITPARAETRSRPPPEKASARREAPEPSKAPEPDDQRKRLEAEVQAALQNRAIAGVVVSIVEDTVYLDGRVASIRQKAMAERAARSVAEVKRVRNRLDVARS
jgi:hypothetical protein